MNQYETEWKRPTYASWGLDTYPDFNIDNTWNGSCKLPVLWSDDGLEVDPNSIDFPGCYNSEFDQFGDMEAFGVHPDWQRQLAKFAGVQDRLREWNPSVMAKLQKYPCLAIQALDIDAIRIDKSTQITLDALANWTTATKACAASVGKNNFYVVGEVTGGDTFGSLYMYQRLFYPSRFANLSAVAEVARQHKNHSNSPMPSPSSQPMIHSSCEIALNPPWMPSHFIIPPTAVCRAFWVWTATWMSRLTFLPISFPPGTK